jgi:hypothetical protein
MMSPTARMLKCLLLFTSAADVLDSVAARLPAEQVRVTRVPEYRVMLPGDQGYDQGDPDAEFGWVALRPLTR